ncbi:MAG: hypothetical protein K5790_01510 [Nitrosopumilus sp.]|uniref:hypothetical protein n=1 Tax=Nitrosopumilus sp. TaxID=2024843 RepID=UPI00247EFA9C|nr:hypothetical protein [Nitrosopumilus sp.]MCV0391951.1 hypothetical protein [Nitrosopumilus sp.]
MKSIFLMITLFALTPLVIPNVSAMCAAEINYDNVLKESELAFTGTVTRLDNYDGPQKVTFLIHGVVKGEVNLPKHIFENNGMMFLENDTVTSSSVDVDYKIGKTYKVYVIDGETSSCTTKITASPEGYMWEPGPEDGNYYSENSVYVDPCDEGYGLSDGVCVTFEEMNKDLSSCDPNPNHDFGKCKKNTEEPDNKLQDVLDNCTCQESGQDCIEPLLRWWNTTHFIDNTDCEFIDRVEGSPTYAKPFSDDITKIPEPEPEQNPLEYETCGPGTTLQDGVCVVNSENENVETGVKWGSVYEKLPAPDLEPILDYDYELIYLTIFVIVVIIGVAVGSVIFVIRRKRK